MSPHDWKETAPSLCAAASLVPAISTCFAINRVPTWSGRRVRLFPEDNERLYPRLVLITTCEQPPILRFNPTADDATISQSGKWQKCTVTAHIVFVE